MKAAIVRGPGQTPVYGDFSEPAASEGESLVSVTASAMSRLAKGRASGTDVPGDDPAIVASGPTDADPTTFSGRSATRSSPARR